VPPGQIPSIIEYSHRFLGLIASGFILATCILWARTHNWSPRVVAGGATVGVLLLAQIILGAVTVKLELPPYVVLVHLGMAEILLGMLTFVAAHASPAPRLVGAAPNLRFRNLAVGGMAAVYLLVLTGANVRANEASWACAGFPLCSGQFAPFGIDRLMDIQLLHRFFAYLVAAHLLVVVARAWRRERGTPALRTAAGFVLAALLAQIGIGAGMVSMGVPMVAQVLHVAGASAVWATIVGLTAIVWRARQSAGEAG
jgi:heme A synthase